MMKRISLITLLFPVAVFAQQTAPLKPVRPAEAKTYNMYSGSSMGSSMEIVDKPVKPFSFDMMDGKTLKSEDLKGKVVLLDFWATWCKPCRMITHELDSSLKANMKRPDFQMIGVNYRESVAAKAGAAKTYWTDNGYSFPSTTSDDAYGNEIAAGNPTIVLIDQHGKVRGRWDAWTRYRTEEITTLAQILLDNPLVTDNDLIQAVAQKEYIKALHYSDQFIAKNPEQLLKLAPIKFDLLLKRSGKTEAFVFLKPIIDTIGSYHELGKSLLKDSNVDVDKLSRESIFEHLLVKNKADKDPMIYQVLWKNYNEAGDKANAKKALQKAILAAKANNDPPQMLNWMIKELEKN